MNSVKLISVISLATISLHVVIDFIMGEEAEYLNAWFLLKNIFSDNSTQFISIQSMLGNYSTAIVTFSFLLVHIVLASIIVYVYRRFA